MKKIALTVFLATALISLNQSIKAQDSFVKGDVALNLGFGVTSGLGLAPVCFGADFMINDFISAGAELDYRWDRANYYYSVYGDHIYSRNGIAFITRGQFHFNDLLKLPGQFDVFAGIDLGLGFYGKSKAYYDYVYWDSKVYFLAGPQVGGRWFFTDKLGLYVITGFRSNDGADFGFGLTFKVN
jgi:hypothetical protein